MSILELSDAELQNAAQACRIAARQAEGDAEKQASSSMRPHFIASAKRYQDLAEKLERTRKAGSQ